jgi:hypothetical protein
MSKTLTTWEVLRNRFPESECVLLAEVSDASGFSRSRSLDFMVINLWQSRGLSISGIERKSNRPDWLKELKNPAKQENHFKHCDYFYLLTDKEGVAKLEEIPETWGWYHINENQVLKIMKAAPKLTPVPIDRSFLCAMLRRAANKEKYVHVDTLKTRIEERALQLQTERNFNQEREASEYRTLKDAVDDFEKASGVSIRNWYATPAKIGEAVRIIVNGNLKGYIERMERVESHAKNIYDDISKNVSELTKTQKQLQQGSLELSTLTPTP